MNYRRITLRKRDGSTRPIMAPSRELKREQAIIGRALASIGVAECVHGFVAGRSTRTNAQSHCGRFYVVNFDLVDFFGTITSARLRGALECLGVPVREAARVASLCTVRLGRVRALAQGSPASPAASNLVCRRLDSRLDGLARSLGWTYTRYADDITLSGDFAVQSISVMARAIIKSEGFTVNERKTRVYPRAAVQLVTGLVVNGPTPTLPRDTILRLSSRLKTATKAEAQGIKAFVEANK